MRSLLSLLFLLVFSMAAHAQEELDSLQAEPVDTISILEKYVQLLQEIVAQRDSAETSGILLAPNAYFFQIASTPTLYKAPQHQMMAQTDSTAQDIQLQRVIAINKALSQLYVQNPWLVAQTEEEVLEQGKFREDISEKLNAKDKLSEKVKETANLTPEADNKVEVVTRRPNFWKVSGQYRLHFNQASFSKNWFQGGEDSYNGATYLVLNFNYNNQKKVTWNNTINADLGFTTSKTDKSRAFRPNANSLRYTTNFGYQAIKNLYYSNNITMSTSIVPNYQANTKTAVSDILSPLDVTIAPGLRYNIAWGKKKKFTGTINVAPLAYNIRYVHRESLVTRYGVRPGHHSYHKFGPNIVISTNLPIMKQISWSQRIYWFSNLEMTKIEWENNFNFTISKLISASLRVYPRIDDSVKRYKLHGKYLMITESLSLGLTYNFSL